LAEVTRPIILCWCKHLKADGTLIDLAIYSHNLSYASWPRCQC
jgi:hypothetical protein